MTTKIWIKLRTLRARLLNQVAAPAFMVMLSVAPLPAAAQAQMVPFDIAPQSLADTLLQISRQSNIGVMAPAGLTGGRSVQGIHGKMSVEEALMQALKGTDLKYRAASDGSFVIEDSSSSGTSSRPKQKGEAPSPSHSVQTAGLNSAAQTSFTSPTDNVPSHIEEVVVTATKRAASVRDVPMSIAVIGNQDIERRGLIGMEDYLRSIPGVNQIDVGGRDNAIVIRGITTSPANENAASGATVATYFDETSITGGAGLSAGGIDIRPVDIERIEVLRGPQGTSFGDASLGGVLRIIPKKPDLNEWSGKVSGSYSNTERYGGDNSMVQGVLNIPVIPGKLAIRAVAYQFDESGAYRNIVGNDAATIARAQTYGLGSLVQGYIRNDIGRMLSEGGRLAVLWAPADNLDVSFNYLRQTIKQDGWPVSDVGSYLQSHIPASPLWSVRGQDGELADTKIDLWNATVNYNFGWAKLTSIASMVESGSISVNTGIFPPPYSTTNISKFKSITEETRLVSQLDGPFQFLSGIFYENTKDRGPSDTYWPGTAATNPYSTNPILFNETDRNLVQYAFFGEASYNLTDKLTATVGARYFNYDKDEISLREGAFAGNIPIGSGVRTTVQKDEGGPIYKANLSYKPVDDSLLYASFSQGFRLGRPTAGVISTCDANNDGIVDGTNVTVASTRSINSDSLDNYEVGAKSSFFDQRLVLDATAFHIDWNGLPTSVLISCSGLSRTYIANAGSATSDGGEIQASLMVAEGLRADFGAAYTHANLSRAVPALGVPNGARLPGSPTFSANMSLQYEFRVSGHKAFVREDSLYTGAFYGDLLQTPGLRAGDYFKMDARAGIQIAKTNIELYVKNVMNENAFTWRGAFGGTNPFAGYQLRPRTIGIQVGYIIE